MSHYESSNVRTKARIPLRNRQVWIFDGEELLIYSLIGFVACAVWFGWQRVILALGCTATGHSLDASQVPNCSGIGGPTIAAHSISGWLWILGGLMAIKLGNQLYQAFGPKS